MTTPIPKLTYNLRTAADATGLSPRSIRRLIDDGTLPSFKPAGLNVRLIKGADLAAWIDREAGTKAAPAEQEPVSIAFRHTRPVKHQSSVG